MKLEPAARRDLLTFVGVACAIFVLSPVLAVFAVVTGFITLSVSALVSRLSRWPYTRTLLAVGGGFLLGSLPYFVLAGVLLLINPT